MCTNASLAIGRKPNASNPISSVAHVEGSPRPGMRLSQPEWRSGFRTAAAKGNWTALNAEQLATSRGNVEDISWIAYALHRSEVFCPMRLGH